MLIICTYFPKYLLFFHHIHVAFHLLCDIDLASKSFRPYRKKVEKYPITSEFCGYTAYFVIVPRQGV